MNYGNKSQLTSEDRADLKILYETAWSGALTQTNGTPIRFVRPFHTSSAPTNNMLAVREVYPTGHPRLSSIYVG
jgi:hypothetical protein